MGPKRYIKHPVVPTELGKTVLRARLSLRETQVEFAKRMRVTPVTVHNWECGKTLAIQAVHKEMLSQLTSDLKKAGVYINDDVFTTVFRTQLEQRGNALA